MLGDHEKGLKITSQMRKIYKHLVCSPTPCVAMRNRRKFLHVTGERRQTLSEHESVFQFILKSLFSALFFLTFIGWQDPQPGNLNKILPSSFPFIASSISADLQESYTWRMFESMKSKLRMRYPETRHRCGE